MDAGTCVALALPAVICLGPWVALAVLTAVAVEAIVHHRLLSSEEKRQLVAGLLDYRERFRTFRLRPQSAGRRS
jgi:hypothetical protein